MKDEVRDIPKYYELNIDAFYPSCANILRYYLGTKKNFEGLLYYLRRNKKDNELSILLGEFIDYGRKNPLIRKTKVISISNVLIDEYCLFWVRNSIIKFCGIKAKIVIIKNNDGYNTKYVFFDSIDEIKVINSEGASVCLNEIDCDLIEVLERTNYALSIKTYLGYDAQIVSCNDDINNRIDVSVFRQLVYDLGLQKLKL